MTGSAPDWAGDPQHWLVTRAQRDTEAAAAFTILAGPQFAPRVARWIGDGPDTGSIFFQNMLAGYSWSSGERALLTLAAHLWNSSEHPGVDLDYLLCGAMSEDWLAVALDAMAARHGRPLPVGGDAR